MAVPIRADGWVAGRWRRRSRLRAREDARLMGSPIEDHSIELLVDGTNLQLEILHGRVHTGPLGSEL
jgi:hypothetical protein